MENDIKKIEKQLEEFIENDPKAKEYQDKVNRLLENSPDKMATLRFLLEENLQKLREELEELSALLEEKDNK